MKGASALTIDVFFEMLAAQEGKPLFLLCRLRHTWTNYTTGTVSLKLGRSLIFP
jgi:hypothetical protein